MHTERRLLTNHLNVAHTCERLHPIRDDADNLIGVIAIHSSALGPAAGGCRLRHYLTDRALIEDALRLAEGMSYKNALAGLPFGGGKAVLNAAYARDRRALLHKFGEALERLHGRYITAEDVGTTVADMTEVRRHTTYVAGLDRGWGLAGGNPSYWTALGVFFALEETAREVLNNGLRGTTIAVQGLGSVGSHLCALLHRIGAKLIVSDLDADKVAMIVGRFGAKAVSPDEILAVEADMLAPCALGAILNSESIPALRVRAICGGANNQLATPRDGQALADRGILYAPDYVVNAGGIINVAAEYLGETTDQVQERIRLVPARLRTIFETARVSAHLPYAIADDMALCIIDDARRSAVDRYAVPAS
jgi:leucine dehydrogenase